MRLSSADILKMKAIGFKGETRHKSSAFSGPFGLGSHRNSPHTAAPLSGCDVRVVPAAATLRSVHDNIHSDRCYCSKCAIQAQNKNISVRR
jgi:hypothetical protein